MSTYRLRIGLIPLSKENNEKRCGDVVHLVHTDASESNKTATETHYVSSILVRLRSNFALFFISLKAEYNIRQCNKTPYNKMQYVLSTAVRLRIDDALFFIPLKSENIKNRHGNAVRLVHTGVFTYR